MIGDPDGKKQERDLRNRQVVEQNAAALAAQFATIFDGEPFEIVNNNDWFQSIGFVDFLHQVGKHVSMTQLLDRDFVQQRIGEGGSGISYAEFSYSLMQGYDFLHLYRTKGATLQLCGADQWGNSVTGVSLIRKLADGEAHVFSTPLIINKQTGVKFGKSEGGAVWLDGRPGAAVAGLQGAGPRPGPREPRGDAHPVRYRHGPAARLPPVHPPGARRRPGGPAHGGAAGLPPRRQGALGEPVHH